MRAVLQRLVIPALLLAAFIGANIAADRFGNDPLPEPDTTVTTDSVETPFFSIRRAPELLTSPRANEELTADLDRWVATLPPNSCFVASAGGERLYEHQADLPVTPASNMKLLTAVAALQALGPDFRFETTVAALQRPDENGRLGGDLYVIGGGDPLLMTDAYLATLPADRSPIHSSADDLADQTIATNIADIDGAVVVVEDRYDLERAPSSILPGDLDNSLIGSLSAAMIDRGFVGFKEQYSSQNAEVPPPLPRSSDPAAEFAATFDDLLEARNVRISSRSRVEPAPPTDQLITLLSFQSPPLAQIVEQMLRDSDNTTAEMLVKELGFLTPTTDTGSTTSGLLEMTSQLNELGVAGSSAFAFDGSGLSAESKVTCNLVHDTINAQPHKDTLRAAMSVAGESGTLADDFIGTKGEGRLRAKTGFLNQASALSGYFVTDPGVEVTFSLIINVTGEEVLTPEQVSGWQRPLPDVLAPFPSGAPLADLGPAGVTLETTADGPIDPEGGLGAASDDGTGEIVTGADGSTDDGTTNDGTTEDGGADPDAADAGSDTEGDADGTQGEG